MEGRQLQTYGHTQTLFKGRKDNLQLCLWGPGVWCLGGAWGRQGQWQVGKGQGRAGDSILAERQGAVVVRLLPAAGRGLHVP